MPAFLVVASWSLALAVNLAPFALGSNRVLPWVYNAVICGAIAIAVALYWLVRPRSEAPVRFGPILLPVLLFTIVAVWIGLQISPFGARVFGGHPIWDYAAEPTGTAGGNGRISVNTAETAIGLTRFLTYGSVFLAAFILAQRTAAASFLIKAFLAFAGIQALYGLVRIALSWKKILWFDVPADGYLTAGFVNRNSAATYFGLAVIAGAAIFLRQVRREHFNKMGHSLRYRVVAVVSALAARFGVSILVFLVPMTALLMTASRGGILATLGGLAALLVLVAMRRTLTGSRRSGPVQFTGLLGIALLVVVVFQMSGARFVDRLALIGMEAQGRLDVYQVTLPAIRDNALRGTGYGTFQDIYPLYRRGLSDNRLVWDKAHNDYLELILGLGVPAASIFLVCLSLIFVTALRGYFRRRRNAIFPGIAVASTVVVAVHAAVDFSTQIQAVAMAYAMILGIGAAQSHRRSVAA